MQHVKNDFTVQKVIFVLVSGQKLIKAVCQQQSTNTSQW